MMRFGNGIAPRGFFPGGMPIVFGGLMMFLMIALLIVILVFVIKMYRFMEKCRYSVKPDEKPSKPYSSAAVDILNERLARGEIGEEEYKAKRELLIK